MKIFQIFAITALFTAQASYSMGGAARLRTGLALIGCAAGAGAGYVYAARKASSIMCQQEKLSGRERPFNGDSLPYPYIQKDTPQESTTTLLRLSSLSLASLVLLSGVAAITGAGTCLGLFGYSLLHSQGNSISFNRVARSGASTGLALAGYSALASATFFARYLQNRVNPADKKHVLGASLCTAASGIVSAASFYGLVKLLGK